MSENKKKNPQDSSVRVQITVAQSVLDIFNVYIRLAGLTSLKALINTAFTVFIWAVRERAKGNIIASVSPDGRIREYDLEPIALAAESLRRERSQNMDKECDRVSEQLFGGTNDIDQDESIPLSVQN